MQTNRSNLGALVGGALLIGFGVLTLSIRLLQFVNWGLFWPLLVVGFGMLLFIGMLAGGKQFAVLAIPGSLISGTGLVLLFQQITGHWELISYFWTLIILFLGVGIYIMGWHGEDVKQKEAGWQVIRVGLILFFIFGTFFEIIFSSFNPIFFPVLLITVGIYILLKRAHLFNGNRNSSHPLPPVR